MFKLFLREMELRVKNIQDLDNMMKPKMKTKWQKNNSLLFTVIRINHSLLFTSIRLIPPTPTKHLTNPIHSYRRFVQ